MALVRAEYRLPVMQQQAFPNVYYDKAHRRYIALLKLNGKTVYTGRSRESCHAYIDHCRYCINRGLPYDSNFLSIAFDIANTLPENTEYSIRN